MTKEEIEEKLRNIDNGYQLLEIDDFGSKNAKITVKCNVCGNIFIRSIDICINKHTICMCTECRIEEHKRKIEKLFPVISNGIKYNLIDVYHNKEKYTYFVSVIDENGYKFYIEAHRLLNKNNKSRPVKFFKHNPYTLENIYVFMKSRDIVDLKILTENIHKLKAATLLDVEIKGKVYQISWNDISNNPARYSMSHIDDFMSYIDKRKLSKQEVVDMIFNMAKEKGEPLCCEDFDGDTTNEHVGIRLIWKYFGTVQNMQKELGLPVTSDSKILQDDELLSDIHHVCDTVFKNENRKLITSSDFEKYSVYKEVSRYNTRCKKIGFSLRSYIEDYGYEYQQCGRGMNFKFEDGEITVSKYEYDFSLFLRNNGFKFGKTYVRNIYYKDIDEDYNGAMTCDYKIIFDNKIVYIELAGILGNTTYQNAYINNTVIKSKSKEEYRQKLNRKREMFERNGLEYYILLPFEMNEEKYNEILMKYQGDVEICT